MLAVSGGVDSMALLDLLAKKPDVELVVAHFDHGIRPDSAVDRQLVEKAAKQLGLVFESGSDQLGPSASEDVARKARYQFLNEVLAKHQAQKVITAHHQDDLIETALINLLRGSGRQGLSAIANNRKVLRPLLGVSKQQIIEYAQSKGLKWREDASNSDVSYLRNYLRLKVLSKLDQEQRRMLISNIDKVAIINNVLDNEFATLSQYIGLSDINRRVFSELPTEVGDEYITYLLRRHQVKDYDSTTVSRLSTAIKTAKPNSKQPIKQTASLNLTVFTASLVTA